jgi:hypothetical protein
MNPTKNLIEPKPYMNPQVFIGIHVKFRFYQVFSGVHEKFSFYQVLSGIHVKFKFYQIPIKTW